MSRKDTPPAAPPKPGQTPGYSENHPRDREDAHDPAPKRKRNPDEGGLDREPERMPGD